jgi:hypothetical protein
LCAWNLLRKNIYVTNRRGIKLVCETLMETEKTKKEMKMRKEDKEGEKQRSH